MLQKMLARTMRSVAAQYQQVIKATGAKGSKRASGGGGSNSIPSNNSSDYLEQALFYLESNEYNMDAALKVFKADMKVQVQVYKQNKGKKGKSGGKRRSGKKDCVIF